MIKAEKEINMKYYKILIKPIHFDESERYVVVESEEDLRQCIDDAVYKESHLGETPAFEVVESNVHEYIEQMKIRCIGKIVVEYADKYWTGSLKGDEIKYELEARALEKFLGVVDIFK